MLVCANTFNDVRMGSRGGNGSFDPNYKGAFD
jgi:hypothetical protein